MTSPPTATTQSPQFIPTSSTSPCTATTAGGQPCGFPPRRGALLCTNHDPNRRDERRRNQQAGVIAASQARKARAEARLASSVYGFDTWALADRASIQAMIDTVIRLELAGRLPEARVRNLLRALTLAVRNFDPATSGRPLAGRPRHDLARYRYARRSLDQQLEVALAEAAFHDGARATTAPPPS